MQKKNQAVHVTKEKMAPRNVIKSTKKKIEILKNELEQYLNTNGYLSYSAKAKKYVILGTNSPRTSLAQCPKCNIGQLMIIKSPTTKKRFIGCSNYNNGCDASSPLLQKAKIRRTKKLCELCSWPLILYRYSRKQEWTKQCANIRCKSRKTKV